MKAPFYALGIFAIYAGLWCQPTLGAGFHATGQDLLTVCAQAKKLLVHEPVDDPEDLGYCYGYLMGFTGFQRLEKLQAFCTHGFTMGQTALVVLNYLEDHPEELHLNANIPTFKALNQAFPCNIGAH